MWDKIEISSICKLLWKLSTSLFSVTLLLQEDGFSPMNLLIHFLREAEGMVDVQTFLEFVHTRAEFAMWVSLWFDDLSFLWRSWLERDLSSCMEEKRNRTLCSKDPGTYLLLYFPGLVSMQCIMDVDGTVGMQTDPGSVVPCVF